MDGHSPLVMDAAHEVDQFNLSPEKFCNGTNINECVQIISQECQCFGVSLDPAEVTNDGAIDVILNSLHSILKKMKESVCLRSELQSSNNFLAANLERTLKILDRTKLDLEEKQKEICDVNERERRARIQNASLSSKLKEEKSEVRKLRSMLQHKEDYHKHERRKSEIEMDKLKERLNKMFSSKSSQVKLGMEISQALQDAGRPKWKLGSRNDDVFGNIVEVYEKRQKELMLENGQMRECLVRMHGNLESLPLDNQEEMATFSIEENDNKPVQYDMPYSIVKESLEKNINHKFEQLRNYFSNVSDRSAKVEVHSREFEELRQQLAACKETLGQQEICMQNILSCGQSNDEDNFLRDMGILEERDSLAAEKQLFYDQKLHFQEERRRFTESAIKLAKERRTFNEDKASYLRQHFLSMSPFVSGQSTPVGSCNRTLRNCVSSPVCITPQTRLFPEKSPLVIRHTDSQVLNAPSTNELYHFLGINQGTRSNSSSPLIPSSAATSPERIARHADNIHLALFQKKSKLKE